MGAGSSDAEPERGGVVVVGAEADPNLSIDQIRSCSVIVSGVALKGSILPALL